MKGVERKRATLADMGLQELVRQSKNLRTVYILLEIALEAAIAWRIVYISLAVGNLFFL